MGDLLWRMCSNAATFLKVVFIVVTPIALAVQCIQSCRDKLMVE